MVVHVTYPDHIEVKNMNSKNGDQVMSKGKLIESENKNINFSSRLWATHAALKGKSKVRSSPTIMWYVFLIAGRIQKKALVKFPKRARMNAKTKEINETFPWILLCSFTWSRIFNKQMLVSALFLWFETHERSFYQIIQNFCPV